MQMFRTSDLNVQVKISSGFVENIELYNDDYSHQFFEKNSKKKFAFSPTNSQICLTLERQRSLRIWKTQPVAKGIFGIQPCFFESMPLFSNAFNRHSQQQASISYLYALQEFGRNS